MRHTELVARLTGRGSVNRTDERFGIHGTDLGITWDDGAGRVFVAFGDTYGAGWCGNGAGPSHGADWRCNALGISTDDDLDSGLLLDEMVCREHDGSARQIIDRDARRRTEETVIPTSGIAVDGVHYLHYMSVRRWGGQGEWVTNYAGIATSTDGGRTWTKPDHARWPNRRRGDHPFQQAAFARHPEHRDTVYLVGTPNGRWGDGHLARVRTSDMLWPHRYEYLAGRRWHTGDPYAATPVMPGPVAELSVRYNVHFGQWVALHLDERRAAIVLRTAGEPAGPWSAGQVVVSGADYPGLYGGFLHPRSAAGTTLYWTLSQWSPYNVYLMRTELAGG